tara:strand:- start:854 stop:1651 length:798 start_codon:yes stop_codon:yes gene_type:complete
MRNNLLTLNGKNIIITRAIDRISEVKILFEQKGAKIYDFPALVIGYPDDLRPLDDAILKIKNFHWIIFSSSNGIKFLEKRLIEKGSSLKIWSQFIKIAVVGQKTAATLNEFGIKADYIPPKFIAESLIDNFPVPRFGLSVLLPRVQTGGRNLISDEFRKAGASVVEVAAYESKCPEAVPSKTLDALNQGIIDAMIFSSGKTVENSAFLLRNSYGSEWLSVFDKIKLLSIGPQTSLACKRLFGRVDHEATNYTFEGLLDIAMNYLI